MVISHRFSLTREVRQGAAKHILSTLKKCKIGFIRKVFTGWGVAGKRKAGAHTDMRRTCDMNPHPLQ